MLSNIFSDLIPITREIEAVGVAPISVTGARLSTANTHTPICMEILWPDHAISPGESSASDGQAFLNRYFHFFVFGQDH